MSNVISGSHFVDHTLDLTVKSLASTHQATAAKPTGASGAVTSDTEVSLSTAAQIRSLGRTGASVPALSAMFQMSPDQVQDDLGMYPTSMRVSLQDLSNFSGKEEDLRIHSSESDKAVPGSSVQDPHVELSTASKVQSLRLSGASVNQIAAALGMSIAQISVELQTSSSTALQAVTSVHLR